MGEQVLMNYSQRHFIKSGYEQLGMRISLKIRMKR